MPTATEVGVTMGSKPVPIVVIGTPNWVLVAPTTLIWCIGARQLERAPGLVDADVLD